MPACSQVQVQTEQKGTGAVFGVARFGPLPRLPLDLAPVLNSRVNEHMYH